MNARGLVKKGESFVCWRKAKKAPLGGALKDFGLGLANLPFMGSGFLFFGEGAELLTEAIFCTYIIIQVLHLVQ